MENRSGETNNPQNSAENAFDYAAADITNELPRGDMLQDPAGEPFQSTFEEEKPKKLNFFNKIGRMNPQKRAVLLVRIFIAIAFSVLFAVYCVKNRANFEIDSLAVSAVSLAVFTAVLIAAVPQIIKVFSGDDAQLAPSGIEKANGKTFLKIVLAAFVLRAALTIFGMIVFYCLNPKFQGSLFNLWQTAWTKVNTDAPHYCSIAENWYASTGEDRLLIVFFPMLPLLMRGLNLLTHNSFVSAQIINTLASCSAAGVLYLTLRPLLGEKKARLAPFIWLLLPGSIFLNSGMTEPLFMLFTVLCFYALQKKKYLAAGIAAACAGFTRSPGVLLAVPLAIEGIGYCVRRARSGKKVGSAIAEIALSLVISTFGTLAYLYINKVVAGDWFMFSVYQKSNWSQGLGFFFDTARYMYQRAIGDLKAALGSGAFNGTNITSVFVLFLPTVALIVLTPLLILRRARKLPAAYTLHFLAYFALAMGCTWLLSAMRYLSVVPAIIAAIAMSCKSEERTAAIFTVSALAYAGYIFMYMRVLSVF